MIEEAKPRCEECIHYRLPEPLSGILAVQVSGTQDEVTRAIDEIRAKDDADRMKEEAWASAGENGPPTWPHRPRILPYCGLYEQNNYYYVCAVKNRKKRCTDFKQYRRRGTSDCSCCSHRVPATGDAQDASTLYQIAERLTYSSVQSVALQSEYQRREKAIGPAKAFEVREAYRNYGWLPSPPKYLDWCKARRVSNRYDVAQSRNMQGDCLDWAPI